MKIAIVGTGISGLGAAYLLQRNHDISVYEAGGYIGGHSRTISVRDGDRQVGVDTGFIVFNKKNYPLLTGLFEKLEVPVVASDMSFGASIMDGWLEYGSKGMFAQRRNWIRPRYWGMLADVLRFNRHALAFIKDRGDMTLRQCLAGMGMRDWFSRYYLQAMGAAIWSCSTETILEFPAHSFLRFFENHGLLTVNDQPQWYTVKGGSREYVKRLTAPFNDKIRVGNGAVEVSRQADGVVVRDASSNIETFDHVVLACHADQALGLIDQPSVREREVLSAFRYQENRAVTHGDVSFMPRTRKCWASWVYLSEESNDSKPVVSLTYWMNQLQSLQTNTPVFVTLNPGRRPQDNLIHDDHTFRHAVFTMETLKAQAALHEIQGRDRISYCGAWQRYGFHEDGLMSAVAVAKALGSDFP